MTTETDQEPAFSEQEHHPTIIKAMVAALSELTVIEAEHEAEIETKTGGSYSYKFANLGDVIRMTTKVLAKHGLAAMTPVHAYEPGLGTAPALACTVTILHESGEAYTFDPLPFPHGRDAQATGSFITYNRRYALMAALNMATGTEDDDGAGAQPRQEDPTLDGDVLAHFRKRIDVIAETPGAKEDLMAQWREHSELPKIGELRASHERTVDSLIGLVERKVKRGEYKVKCDGEHAVPICDDPNCWRLDPEDAQPALPAESTETPPDAPETAVAPVEVVPPPFDPSELPEGYSDDEDAQWLLRAPDGWNDEVSAEVMAVDGTEAKARCKALGMTTTGGDLAVRARLRARLVRRRMEKALTP